MKQTSEKYEITYETLQGCLKYIHNYRNEKGLRNGVFFNPNAALIALFPEIKEEKSPLTIAISKYLMQHLTPIRYKMVILILILNLNFCLR